jgi:predicted transcriptional regulator
MKLTPNQTSDLEFIHIMEKSNIKVKAPYHYANKLTTDALVKKDLIYVDKENNVRLTKKGRQCISTSYT